MIYAMKVLFRDQLPASLTLNHAGNWLDAAVELCKRRLPNKNLRLDGVGYKNNGNAVLHLCDHDLREEEVEVVVYALRTFSAGLYTCVDRKVSLKPRIYSAA